jgi:hypothetical protein
VEDHEIRTAFKEESDIRHLLAQPTQYNSDGDIKLTVPGALCIAALWP